jgi:hypothetical membrane protein
MAFLCYCNVSSSTTYSRISNATLLTIAEVAIFGLSIVGVVNEDENIVIHSISAGVFFVGMDIYMLVTAVNATLQRSQVPSRGRVACVCVCVSRRGSGSRKRRRQSRPCAVGCPWC